MHLSVIVHSFLLGESMHKICTAIVASTILISPAFANDEGRWVDHDRGRWGDHDRGHQFHGAPGPIAGAGLPVLAVGYGVYWLVRRRRKANGPAAAMRAEAAKTATPAYDN
jgi:hypothetical protein